MEVYWRLASVEASAREAASVELVQSLLLQQSLDKPEKKKHKGEKEKPVKKQQIEESEKPEKSAHKQRRATSHTEEEGEKEAAAFQKNRSGKRQNTTLPSNQTEEKEVEKKEGTEEDGLHNCSPAVQYTLKRLVRGVASSRECARQGFATALASLLEALPYVKIESVLKLIKESLEVTSSMKGQEKRDGLLGQLFALGAVTQSGRLVVDNANIEAANLAKDIAEQLLVLAKRKVFLRELAVTVLLSFMEKLPPGVLQDTVLCSAELRDTLNMDIENTSADVLLLALKLRTCLPYSVVESCPLLPKARSIHALFEPSHLLSLVPVLKESSSCHPRVHPVWSFLFKLLLQESNDEDFVTPSKKKKKRQKVNDLELVKKVDQRVATFWSLIVRNSLLISSHERKYLSMELLQLVLPQLSAPCALIILSKTEVRCLLDILAAKGNLLYKSAKTCLESVCNWAKVDEQRIVTVIVALQHASHGKFDVLSKTQTVKQLVSLLKSKESCFLLHNKLMELFNGEQRASSAFSLSVRDDANQNGVKDEDKEGKGSAEGEKSVEAQRYWVLEQMSSFVKQIDEQDLCWSLQKESLKLLTINALYIGPLGARCCVEELQEELQFPELPMSESTRKLCLARLQNLLVNVSPTVSPIEDNKIYDGEDTHQKNLLSSDLRFYFLELCDMLDKFPNISRVNRVSEDDKDTMNALRLCISQLCSVNSVVKNEQSQKMRAMGSLLMQFLLQSATTGVNDIASELILCCRKAFGELIELGANGIVEEEEGGSVSLMDVLVDILLSLLAQSSAPIRAAAEQVFKSFCGDLSESNMLSLLAVVKKQLRSGRRAPATPLDADESDDDLFLEIEDSDDDGDVIDGGDDDSSEDKNSEDNAKTPDKKRLHRSDSDEGEVETTKENVHSADLDHERSKDNSDSEDSSNSDLDDEAMFKIDVHLANLLKQRGAASGKETKDAQTQLLHFKFRVLSLVEYFFQKKASSPLCLTALPHLLQAFVLSCSAEGNVQLGERISSILQARLFKSKEYPKGEQVDNAALTGLLQHCVKLASRSKVQKVRQVAQSCILWLVKVLHGQPSYGGEEIENLIRDALKDLFSQKKSRLKAPFFRDLFMRFPGIGLACLALLLDSCKNTRSEFLQLEALVLVTSILHFNTGKKSCAFKESLIQHLQPLSGVLVGLIEKPPSNKARRLESRRFYVAFMKAVALELPGKPVEKLIGKPAYYLSMSHFGASVTEGIVTVKGGSSDADSHAKKDKTKKQVRTG